MQITRVELKNIKNHAEADFSFQPGVIAICGPNGAGKTTILEAIAWALFDHLDYNKDDFVKRGAKKGQVVVSFISDKDGREYTVTRDTGGGYHVYDPDTKTRLIEQKNQVVKWLREHLGVDEATDLSALFKTTIGVPQGTFTYDFTLTAAKRKIIFDQILKVEEYKQASDQLRDTLKHIEGRINEADRKMAAAEGELKAYDETKRQHDQTAAQLQQHETDYAAAQTARDVAAQTVAQLDALKQQLETRRAALESLRIKLDVRRGSLATAREALEQARAAAQIVTAAQAGHDNYQAATAKLSELERHRLSRDELRNKLAATEREQFEVQAQAERQRERLQEIADARVELAALADKVAEQTQFETTLAGLRESRGELQGLEHARRALDKDLEQMRLRYSLLSREIEKAEGLRAQAEQVATLDEKRAQLDAELARLELTLKSSQMQRSYLDKARQEQTRLQSELEQNGRELAHLEPLLAQAARLTESETQQQTETEQLAQLRAEVSRDEEMIASLASGGICPLLTEKCLNLKPGESIEARFRTGLTERREQIKPLQSSLKTLAAAVKQARAAAAETAQLPRLREAAERFTRELAAQQEQVAKLESELAQAGTISEAELQQRKAERAALEQVLRAAREAERVFNQAEGMRGELAELSAYGKTRKVEADTLQQRLTALGNIEAQLAAAESSLQALSDPRGRAGALQRVIEREAEWQQGIALAEQKVAEIRAGQQHLNEELQQFAALDVQLAEVNVARASNERDYHAYLSNLKIAETLPTHETEVAAIAAEIVTAETTLAATQTELTQLEAQYQADAHRTALRQFEHWRERATHLAAQLEHVRASFSQLQQRLAQLEEVRERMRAQLAEKERAQRLRETTDFIRDILQKAAPFITESYLFSISLEANQLFREITGRHDATLRWAKDYEITLEEEGRERPFANLSGGEQMAAALAVRLALLKELSDLNIAFFDEPTTNMDEERRRNLAQQIGRIKDFQQLFVISHDDTFEGYTDQVISLGERAEGV
ncbi:MAG: SMC family ATPase [Acidobacteria bacterium]|nr:SMC family ATPase [Acidobacteriota bacterium]MBI3423160.1 SMC family ATPase [Acidobacteriota bacterium]